MYYIKDIQIYLFEQTNPPSFALHMLLYTRTLKKIHMPVHNYTTCTMYCVCILPYPSCPNSAVHDTNRSNSSPPTDECDFVSAFLKWSNCTRGTSMVPGTSNSRIRTAPHRLHGALDTGGAGGVRSIGQYSHDGYSRQGV